MQTVSASAPGKIILFGEHAVVYGHPALAVPIHSLSATASITEDKKGSGLTIESKDLNETYSLAKAASNALTEIIRLTLAHLEVEKLDATLTLESTIPMAAGLGSGAAISAAAARALSHYVGKPLSNPELSKLVYKIEKLHHGTPSGIDNTVICYAKPIYFIRGQMSESFAIKQPFHLLIADTGVTSLTKVAVGDVWEGWQANPTQYNQWFGQIGELTNIARQGIEDGNIEQLGELMNKNQQLLKAINVSSLELERLIKSALGAGAQGAKLSGGGRGGNMIALIDAHQVDRVSKALTKAGATRVLHTVVR